VCVNCSCLMPGQVQLQTSPAQMRRASVSFTKSATIVDVVPVALCWCSRVVPFKQMLSSQIKREAKTLTLYLRQENLQAHSPSIELLSFGLQRFSKCDSSHFATARGGCGRCQIIKFLQQQGYQCFFGSMLSVLLI